MSTSIFAGLVDALADLRDDTGGIPRVVGGISASWKVGGINSEAGVGALMPWADRLWFNTYPAENNEAARTGTWSMGRDLVPVLEVADNITSAARVIHKDRLFISRTVVDAAGAKAAITGFSSGMRPAGYAVLPGDSTYVWALSMKGEIWKITAAPPHTATLVADNTGLSLGGAQPHGKSLWGHPGGQYLFGTLNADGGGRLFKFDTTTSTYSVISSDNWPWIESAGSYDGSGPSSLFYAYGHDRKSVRFRMFNPTDSTESRQFRIPLPSRQQLDGWQHEWMRLRQVETERFMFNAYGGFFQLSISTSNRTYATGMPLIEPVCRYARTVTDFVSWEGYLVLGSNQNTSQSNNKYPNAGQSTSGLLLTTTDDLWSWGKPAGDGLWWDNESVTASVESEPMLMNGYDKKMLWVNNGSASPLNVTVKVWHNTRKVTYTTLAVAANTYVHHEFPAGFAADWVSITPDATLANVSAGVVYT